MISVTITATRPRRWWHKKRIVAWRRAIPESWEEIPPARRRRYYAAMLQDGLPAVLQLHLHLPAWATRSLPEPDVQALLSVLTWMQLRPDCERLPFPSFRHKGITYHLPKPKGENISCLEYPLADEYYIDVCTNNSPKALLLLVSTLCREEETSLATTLRRGDARRPLNSRAEIEHRARALADLPAEYLSAVVVYFSGLKEYVRNTYRTWLFEADEPDTEDGEQETAQDPEPSSGPDFGWWGIYQDVAEAGLFGPLQQVYQADFHDVCMWLVRQKMKEQPRSTSPTPTPKQDDDL